MNENTVSKDETSPDLRLEITQDIYGAAVRAKSAACVVADDIKAEYPRRFSNVQVDVATIRITDRKRGLRYIYLTPPKVAELLLAFDQGWDERSFPINLRIREAVKIMPITRSKSMVKKTAQQRAARMAELEAKEQSGQPLTGDETRALTKLRNPKERVPRPTTYGRLAAEISGEKLVAVGGTPLRTHKDNPELLHSRDRHFGAKVAKPNEVLKRALEEAGAAAVAAYKAKRKAKRKQQ